VRVLLHWVNIAFYFGVFFFTMDNRGTTNGWLFVLFVLKIGYFTLSAAQVRLGYPQLKDGRFFMRDFSMPRWVLFKVRSEANPPSPPHPPP
jgi:hypothetical protein